MSYGSTRSQQCKVSKKVINEGFFTPIFFFATNHQNFIIKQVDFPKQSVIYEAQEILQFPVQKLNNKSKH